MPAESGHALGFFPVQRAAEQATTLTQVNGQEVITAGGQTRSGKPDQQAAFEDEIADTFIISARIIHHHQNRWRFFQ